MPKMRRYSEPIRNTIPIAERQRKQSENITIFKLNPKGNLVTQTYENSVNDEDLTDEEDFLLLTKKEVAEKHPAFLKLYLELRKASVVDKVSRILFPFLFASFNVFFWLKYNDDVSPHSENHL